MKVLCALLALFIGLSQAHKDKDHDHKSNSSCDATALPKTDVGRLKKALFCNYDTSTRPALHHINQTSVLIAIFPLDLHVDNLDKNTIWMTFWMWQKWTDDQLTWNTSMYDGLKSFSVDWSKIWTPDVAAIYPRQAWSKGSMSCKVFSNGNVQCVCIPWLRVHCDADLTYFPHDRHNCKITLGSGVYLGSETTFDFFDNQNLNPYQYLRSVGIWKMDSFKANRNKVPIRSLDTDDYMIELEYTFVLKRVSSAWTGMYAVPAFVMVITILSVLWVEVQCSARLILPALCIVSQMIIILWLSRILTNSEQLPIIIEFFRDSLLVSGLVLVWSVAARGLGASSSSPYWLYMASTNLNNKPFIKLILPQDVFIKSGSSGDEDESSLVVHRDCVEQQWRIFTMLMDRLLFAFFTLLYIFQYMRLIQ